MKTIKYAYIFLFFVFVSCQIQNSVDKIDVFSILEEKITSIQEIKSDSIIFPVEIYSFG